MPDNGLQQMMADPAFDKLKQPERYDNVIGWLENAEPDFVKADPKYKFREATAILRDAGKLDEHPMQGGGAGQLQKPLPGAVEFGEDYVAPAVGGVVGAAAGASVGGPIGGAVGAGAGQAAADVASAYINKKFFGRNPDLSLRHVASEEAVNATLGAAFEAIPTERLLRGLVGAKPFIKGAQEAKQAATAQAGKFAEQQAATSASKDEAVAQAHQEVTQQLAPEARGQAVQGQLGRTPEQGAAARAMPPEQAPAGSPAEPTPTVPSADVVERQQQWNDAIFNPVHRASKELGNRYDQLFGAVRNKPIPDTEAIGKTVENINQFSKESNYTYGPQMKRLLQTADMLGKKVDVTKLLSRKGPNKGALNVSNDEWEAVNRQIEAGEGSGNATVGSLLTLRSQALEATRGAAGSRDKAAAFQLVDGIDNTLESSNLVDTKALKALNQRYGSYKRTFDTGFRRKIAGEFEPTDAAGEVFTSPQRFQQIWGGANDEEKSTLRTNYADWVLKNGVDKAPGVLKQEDQRALLKQMYPNTSLAEPKNWIYLDNKLVTAQNVINTSPEMRTQYQQAMKQRLIEAQSNAAKESIKWAQKEAKNLGPYGEAMAKQARTAKSPLQGARVVMDFMKAHPENAPIEALVSGSIEPKPGAVEQRVRRGLTWYPEILLATSLMGHPSVFAAAGMAMAVPTGFHLLMQRTLKNALKNPETAQKFWSAATNPNAFARTKLLGGMASDALMAEAASGIERKLGTALQGQDEPKPPVEGGP